MLPVQLHASQEDAVLMLLLSLWACTPQDLDTAPSGDSAWSAGAPHPLDDPEDVREVVIVAMMTGQLALGAIDTVHQGAGVPGACPSVEETSPATWLVGGEPGSVPEMGWAVEGSYTVRGLAWDDDAFVPGRVEVTWNDFTSTIADGPGGASARQVYDGTASIELREDSLGGGHFDLDFTSEGFPCEVVAAGGASERLWRIRGLERSALWLDDTDTLSGVIEVDGVGAVSLDGTMGWDYATCSTEPVDGSLTLVGEPTVTLGFDGATACDGRTSYSGDQVGEVSWELAG
jgi:hypothetical protein